MLEEDKSHAQIGKELGRTERAIKLRCAKLAAIDIKDEGNTEAILEMYKLEAKDIEDYQVRLCNEQGCNKEISKRSVSGKYCIDHLSAETSTKEELQELKEKMIILENKLDKILEYLILQKK